MRLYKGSMLILIRVHTYHSHSVTLFAWLRVLCNQGSCSADVRSVEDVHAQSFCERRIIVLTGRISARLEKWYTLAGADMPTSAVDVARSITPTPVPSHRHVRGYPVTYLEMKGEPSTNRWQLARWPSFAGGGGTDKVRKMISIFFFDWTWGACIHQSGWANASDSASIESF